MTFNFLFLRDGLDTLGNVWKGGADWEISVGVATNEMGCVMEPGWKVLELW